MKQPLPVRRRPSLFRALALLGLLSAAPDPARAQAYFVDSTVTHLPTTLVAEPGMDVEAADLDNDGDLDLVIANEFQFNAVLVNDGRGRFSDQSHARLPALPTPLPGPGGAAQGHDSEDIAVADFDEDGDLDLLFVSEDDVNMGRTGVHEFYLNDGTGHFTVAPFAFPDSEANAVTTADVDGDGHLDVAVGNAGQDLLLMGNGDGTFRDETATRLPAENRTCQDLEFADLDADGDLDLVLGNETGNRLLMNDGTGHFTDETPTRLATTLLMETRKVALADVDGNGSLDLLCANVNFLPGRNPQNRLYLNDGTGHFTDGTATRLPALPVGTIDAKFADLDADGDLDLVYGHFPQNLAARALLNDGAGFFTDASSQIFPSPVVGDALGIEVADLNADQHLDLYFCFRATNIHDRLLLGLRSAPMGSAEGAPELLALVVAPNPVAPSTTLRFTLDRPADVALELLDASGRRVALTPLGVCLAGPQAITWHPASLPAGPYLIRLHVGGRVRGMARLVRQ